MNWINIINLHGRLIKNQYRHNYDNGLEYIEVKINHDFIFKCDIDHLHLIRN